MKQTPLAILSVLFLSLIFVFVANVQSNNKADKTDKQEKNQSLKIIHKPKAHIGNCEQPSGENTLRVTFDKSAKVTDVEIVTSSGCSSFDNNAIEAAKEIKFNPAIKNGEPITLRKLTKYSYLTY